MSRRTNTAPTDIAKKGLVTRMEDHNVLATHLNHLVLTNRLEENNLSLLSLIHDVVNSLCNTERTIELCCILQSAETDDRAKKFVEVFTLREHLSHEIHINIWRRVWWLPKSFGMPIVIELRPEGRFPLISLFSAFSKKIRSGLRGCSLELFVLERKRRFAELCLILQMFQPLVADLKSSAL